METKLDTLIAETKRIEGTEDSVRTLLSGVSTELTLIVNDPNAITKFARELDQKINLIVKAVLANSSEAESHSAKTHAEKVAAAEKAQRKPLQKR